MSGGGRWVFEILVSMVVAEAINFVWFSGWLPWQPHVHEDLTSALIKGFLLAVAVHELFHSNHGIELEDALRIGVPVATIYLTLDPSWHVGLPGHHGSKDLSEVLLDGVRCTLIICAKVLVMDNMRNY